MEAKSSKLILNTAKIEVKIKALDKLKSGVSVDVIAKDLNVHRTTIYSWVKNEEKLRKWYKNNSRGPLQQRKRMVQPVNHHVDVALWIWFNQQRAAGFPINGNLLKIQALHFCKLFGDTADFKASDGWLGKWKKRHQVRNLMNCDERLSADAAGAEDYIIKFAEMIKEDELTPHQIFNCCETGLNWKEMPRKKWNDFNSRSSEGEFEIQKERVTVMACCNAAGSLKLPLLVIGKSENPRTIKNIKKNLPVTYCSQKSAWMTTHIFEHWFRTYFVPQVEKFLKAKKLPQKATLFMNNCAVHPCNLKVGGIVVEFLPPNTTPLIQPMDQGCLQCIKSRFRIYLINFLLELFDSGHDLLNALEEITIHHVISWFSQSWDSILPSTIIKSWKPLWPSVERAVDIVNFCENLINTQDPCLEESNVEELITKFHQELIQNIWFKDFDIKAISDWVHYPQKLTEDEVLTDKEVVQSLLEDGEGFKFSEEEDSENKSNSISAANYQKETEEKIIEVQNYLNKVIEYCSNNDHYNIRHISSLNQVREALNAEMAKSKSF